MIFPSAVRFLTSIDMSDRLRLTEGLALEDLLPGGKGEGKDEADVLAGAIWRPRGSFRLVFDIRRTEPAWERWISFWGPEKVVLE